MLGQAHLCGTDLPARVGVGLVLIAATAGLTGCGTTEQASRETLPPIATTTSTTTIPGTTLPEGVRRVWIIQRGETLASIAAETGVTVQSIIDLNEIANPDAIQAGQEIEIPADVIVLNSPGAAATTTEVATLDGG